MHSGLNIERQILHQSEMRNVPQQKIPAAKFSPSLYIVGVRSLHLQPRRSRVGSFPNSNNM